MTPSTDMIQPEPDQPAYDARHDSDHKNKWKTLCKTYHHHWVCLQTRDGMYDGILDGTDDENVYMLVPVGDWEPDYRQVPYGYGYGGYFPPYGYPRRFRRFRRFPIPYLLLRSLWFPYFY